MIGAYLIGEPGVGKSTLLRALTEGVDREWRRKPFAHCVYFDTDYRVAGVQIGGDDSRYPGTDRLSMSVQPKAIEWVSQAPAPVVFGEGDRLGTKGFLDALAKATDEWWLFVLRAPSATVEQRRAERGSHQDPTWLQGRRTKVERLAEHYSAHATILDGSRPLAELVAEVREHPACRWIQEILSIG